MADQGIQDNFDPVFGKGGILGLSNQQTPYQSTGSDAQYLYIAAASKAIQSIEPLDPSAAQTLQKVIDFMASESQQTFMQEQLRALVMQRAELQDKTRWQQTTIDRQAREIFSLQEEMKIMMSRMAANQVIADRAEYEKQQMQTVIDEKNSTIIKQRHMQEQIAGQAQQLSALKDELFESNLQKAKEIQKFYRQQQGRLEEIHDLSRKNDEYKQQISDVLAQNVKMQQVIANMEEEAVAARSNAEKEQEAMIQQIGDMETQMKSLNAKIAERNYEVQQLRKMLHNMEEGQRQLSMSYASTQQSSNDLSSRTNLNHLRYGGHDGVVFSNTITMGSPGGSGITQKYQVIGNGRYTNVPSIGGTRQALPREVWRQLQRSKSDGELTAMTQGLVASNTQINPALQSVVKSGVKQLAEIAASMPRPAGKADSQTVQLLQHHIKQLAEELGISENEVLKLPMVADILHDIGFSPHSFCENISDREALHTAQYDTSEEYEEFDEPDGTTQGQSGDSDAYTRARAARRQGATKANKIGRKGRRKEKTSAIAGSTQQQERQRKSKYTGKPSTTTLQQVKVADTLVGQRPRQKQAVYRSLAIADGSNKPCQAMPAVRHQGQQCDIGTMLQLYICQNCKKLLDNVDGLQKVGQHYLRFEDKESLQNGQDVYQKYLNTLSAEAEDEKQRGDAVTKYKIQKFIQLRTKLLDNFKEQLRLQQEAATMRAKMHEDTTVVTLQQQLALKALENRLAELQYENPKIEREFLDLQEYYVDVSRHIVRNYVNVYEDPTNLRGCMRVRAEERKGSHGQRSRAPAGQEIDLLAYVPEELRGRIGAEEADLGEVVSDDEGGIADTDAMKVRTLVQLAKLAEIQPGLRLRLSGRDQALLGVRVLDATGVSVVQLAQRLAHQCQGKLRMASMLRGQPPERVVERPFYTVTASGHFFSPFEAATARWRARRLHAARHAAPTPSVVHTTVGESVIPVGRGLDMNNTLLVRSVQYTTAKRTKHPPKDNSEVQVIDWYQPGPGNLKEAQPAAPTGTPAEFITRQTAVLRLTDTDLIELGRRHYFEIGFGPWPCNGVRVAVGTEITWMHREGVFRDFLSRIIALLGREHCMEMGLGNHMYVQPPYGTTIRPLSWCKQTILLFHQFLGRDTQGASMRRCSSLIQLVAAWAMRAYNSKPVLVRLLYHLAVNTYFWAAVDEQIEHFEAFLLGRIGYGDFALYAAVYNAAIAACALQAAPAAQVLAARLGPKESAILGLEVPSRGISLFQLAAMCVDDARARRRQVGAVLVRRFAELAGPHGRVAGGTFAAFSARCFAMPKRPVPAPALDFPQFLRALARCEADALQAPEAIDRIYAAMRASSDSGSAAAPLYEATKRFVSACTVPALRRARLADFVYLGWDAAARPETPP